MPTDRKSRDQLLDALVSYMKGEVRSDEFGDKRAAVRTKDRSVRGLSYLLYHAHDSYVDHPISATEECWNMLQRYAAFLRTNLELEEVIKRREHPRRGFALFGLAVLAAVFLVALWTSWVLLAGVWLVIGCLWVFVLPAPDTNPEVIRLWQTAPFWNEEECLEYEPLLNGLDLPQYDPAVHNKPIRSEAADWMMRGIVKSCGLCVIKRRPS